MDKRRKYSFLIIFMTIFLRPIIANGAASAALKASDSSGKNAGLDKLLQQGHEAFVSGDFEKANEIAMIVRNQAETSSTKNEAHKLYSESRQKLKQELANRKLQTKIPKPFKKFDSSSGSSVFEQYKVEPNDGAMFLIGGQKYSALETQRYYQLSGSSDSAQLAMDGLNLRSKGKSFLIWNMCIGAGLGVGVGYGYTALQQSDTYGYLRVYTALIGGVSGLIVGTGTGFLGLRGYHRHSDSKFREAEKKFNEYLKHELKLGAQPVPGGAIGYLTLAF